MDRFLIVLFFVLAICMSTIFVYMLFCLFLRLFDDDPIDNIEEIENPMDR